MLQNQFFNERVGVAASLVEEDRHSFQFLLAHSLKWNRPSVEHDRRSATFFVIEPVDQKAKQTVAASFESTLAIAEP